MLKIRIIGLILCVLTLIAFFAACVTNNGDDEPKDEHERIKKMFEEQGSDFRPEGKTITVWSMRPQVEREALLDAFLAEYPDYNITISGTQNEAAIAAAIASGTQPDTFNNWGNLALYYYKGIITDWDNYLEFDPDYNRDDMHFMAYEYCTLHDKLYGLSGVANVSHIVYNKDMLEEYSIPAPPKTWGEMISQQKLIYRLDSQGKVNRIAYTHTDYGGLWYMLAALVRNQPYVDEYGWRVQLNTEDTFRAWEAFTFPMLDVYGGESGLSRQMQFDTSYASRFNNQYQAYALNHHHNGFWLGTIENYGVSIFPVPDDSDPNVCTWMNDMYFLTRGAKNPDGAWLYLRWYLITGYVQVIEFLNFEKDPYNYFPNFILNKASRQRCYDTYFDDMTESSVEAVLERDKLADMNSTYIWGHAMEGTSLWIPSTDWITDVVSKKRSLRESIVDAQRRADKLTENWLVEKNAEGWIINDEIPWGIPPWENENWKEGKTDVTDMN